MHTTNPKLCDQMMEPSVQIWLGISPDLRPCVTHQPEHGYTHVTVTRCGHPHHGQTTLGGPTADLRRFFADALAAIDSATAADGAAGE